MEPLYYLGIDGGGTRTRAVLLDCDGHEKARGDSGPSNQFSAGETTAEASLREAVGQTLMRANVPASLVAAVGLGTAGADRSGDQERWRLFIQRIYDFPSIHITHDADAALVGGAGQRHGIVLIAGTGAIAFGVNSRGESRRADGWGYLMGDEGSAYWIGVQALRAIARADDTRGPRTDLSHRLASYFELSDASELVPLVYDEGLGVRQVAAIASLVSNVAKAGDSVAESILLEAGRRLGASLCAVVSGLGMSEDAFTVVLSGGVFEERGLVWQTVEAAAAECAPHGNVIKPRRDASVGAAMLAMATVADTGPSKKTP